MALPGGFGLGQGAAMLTAGALCSGAALLLVLPIVPDFVGMGFSPDVRQQWRELVRWWCCTTGLHSQLGEAL